jgi:hypothetical protein
MGVHEFAQAYLHDTTANAGSAANVDPDGAEAHLPSALQGYATAIVFYHSEEGHRIEGVDLGHELGIGAHGEERDRIRGIFKLSGDGAFRAFEMGAIAGLKDAIRRKEAAA